MMNFNSLVNRFTGYELKGITNDNDYEEKYYFLFNFIAFFNEIREKIIKDFK